LLISNNYGYTGRKQGVKKMIDTIEAIGLCAGACTTLSFLPQLKKVIVTKSVQDISYHMYILYCSGLLLWNIYGICIKSPSLIIANFFTLVFALSILVIKIRLDRANKLFK
jgi:MtN3 and saliva related transmembrane protein